VSPQWWLDLSDVHALLDKEAPETYKCPIEHDIMCNPWMLRETTTSCEYAALYEWVIKRRKRKDPKTAEAFYTSDMIKNKSLHRDIRRWSEKRAGELREENVRLEGALAAPLDRELGHIHVFVDYSNLSISPMREGRRINIGKVVQTIHRSRTIQQKVVVGSANSSESDWERWRELGYKRLVDSHRGREENVDELLHSQLAKVAGRTFPSTRIIVLVTGDGNNNGGRASFPCHIENALLHNFWIELYSWKGSLSNVYLKFEKNYGARGQFKIVYLDDCDCLL
jgi:hypothetical protein